MTGSTTGDDMLHDRRIFTYRELATVPVLDVGEPLVPMRAYPEAAVATDDLRFPWIRAGALHRLLDAGRMLRRTSDRSGLHVWCAYRSLAVQKAGFERYTREFGAKHPTLRGDELIEFVHLHVAVPDVAGHPTGGAVDVTIVEDGRYADMGGAYGDFTSPTLHTFSDGLTEVQQQNRLRLRTVMVGAGFAPFNGEWWHFSYGDKEWAAMRGAPTALYAQVEAPAR